ncbi:DegT/DnrJ/EryC1/StrS family aminotransferase [Winogradskyella thalassocola]|uniref:dTDP-4-amino-4,6-dideoxygalactose transaminase n=1 Tax=Winogradskyella thalassocola TaxID=262004 RepID=A0A1G8FX29_9FLAO|nr:DegT/DnrJ/EryC1/StrS family aminotransferase [Winogradskyella thalassocola]SDH86667.1 dTDP-4-amino-4,6-dideoxygalactose transaminase [Winogradskyella thalassocola]
MINVTKTFLPEQSEYQAILKRAWDTGWMTNRGVLVKELEDKLKELLNVPNVIAMTNGTLPLQIAIKAMDLSGEIITTPFSYVATASSIAWERCEPVFVDIHPEYLTIDETKLEEAITSSTTAILATHVFGNPCHVEAIEAIAKKHDLKVIYDAAHCFGVAYKGQSLFNYGDASTCSFHATKVFHTGEGGAVFTKDKELYNTFFAMHNFGHDGPEAFQSIGINAKMSELQGAMGLAVLPYMKKIINARRTICEIYNEAFKDTELQLLKLRSETEWNFSYFPVIFKSEEQLLRVKDALNSAQIFPRRYFYPSLNTLEYVNNVKCPESESIAPRVLCLPMYPGLTISDVNRILTIVIEEL